MNPTSYILISTGCLSVFYALFRLLFKHETNFRQLRLYLIFSMILALLLPLNSLTIDFTSSIEKEDTRSVKTSQTTEMPESPPALITNPSKREVFLVKAKEEFLNAQTIGQIAKLIYLIVAFGLFFRLIFNVTKVILIAFSSQKKYFNNYILVINRKFEHTFSFFIWIFVNTSHSSGEELNQMLEHEKIHVSQNHSFDLMLTELLAAVMWFNPVVWKMRKDLQLVHEYLADEGALNTGIDKLKYQTLLVNQVTEERLVCLSSSFNHSLIKKRMIMMNKNKVYSRTKLKILAVVPVAAVLFFGVACVNGQNQGKTLAAVAPVKMNVLYLGVDNPINVAVSGYDVADISIEVENGRYEGKNGQYIIRPIRPGSLTVTVKAGDQVIQQSEFRVKTVPNPVAAIEVDHNYLKSGSISKAQLLNAKSVVVFMENFDFDLSFKVVSFVMSSTTPGTYTIREEISNSEQFSDNQIDLINSLVENQKLMIEEIVAVGPDGSKRKLSPMVFNIRK